MLEPVDASYGWEITARKGFTKSGSTLLVSHAALLAGLSQLGSAWLGAIGVEMDVVQWRRSA